MAKLRKGVAYSKDVNGRPYTRKSKFRSKQFVRSTPVCKVVRFDSGATNRTFEKKIVLVSTENVQLRHNCLESARMAAQRTLDKVIPKTDYHFKIRPYPHHHLRENPLASGAGADRMSTGMKKSFGKVIGLAARVKKNQIVMEVKTKPEFLDVAKDALRKANTKLPKKCKVLVQ